MKRIILSLAVMVVVATAAVGVTRAYFSDSVTSSGNTFVAGTLDLEVGGAGFVPFSVTDLKPGDSKGSPTYAITNTGSLPGMLSFKVKNVVTNENGVLEPETDAGDDVGVRLDPDGFSIVASGEGELLDQVFLTFWVDDTDGQRPSPSDWLDTKFWTGYPDESSHYSLTPDTDLMAGKKWKSGPDAGEDLILQPGQTAYIGVGAQFISDTSTSYNWILDGVKNNAAMSDDFEFDIEVGLNQII